MQVHDQAAVLGTVDDASASAAIGQEGSPAIPLDDGADALTLSISCR
jgi:hypothetical protein